MKFKSLKNHLWFNIFIRIAIIFVVFVLIIAVSNVALLVGYFSKKEKRLLKEQIISLSQININDTPSVLKQLSRINEEYNFDVEIYYENGLILYTTHGSQMMDFFSLKNNKFTMSHDDMITIKSENLSNGVVFRNAIRTFDKSEYLVCNKKISDELYAEVRIQKQLLSNSAEIANEFIIIVSIICFIASVIWVLIFAKKFSKPISEMNVITKDMTGLDFERKVKVSSNDEIGQLAVSINELSSSLSDALQDLENTNAKLQSDIELERQLDVMRKGFVANVSHELKTPISIISGYAEGLKLNVNSSSKEEYCNIIIDESKRMNRLVLSILELSRYESGQIPLTKQTFDISLVAEEMLKRLFKNSSIIYKNMIPKNTNVSADPIMIEQVFKSYLENALSHTPADGTVNVTCEEKSNYLRISVINSGSHIDETIMPQIWQSFYRGEQSHKRENSRFGLGLSIVSAIMKLHSHQCGVYNTDNGVCFWFDCDIADNEE